MNFIAFNRMLISSDWPLQRPSLLGRLVLYAIWRHHGTGLTPARVATMLGMPRAQVSTNIGALCDMGLVARERSVEDRRVVYLFATPELLDALGM